MSIKNFLTLLLTLSLLLQIFFSIYYSSEIINQSNNHANLLKKIDNLEIEHQNLQTKLAIETSLDKLNQYLEGKSYKLIWQQINLNQQ